MGKAAAVAIGVIVVLAGIAACLGAVISILSPSGSRTSVLGLVGGIVFISFGIAVIRAARTEWVRKD